MGTSTNNPYRLGFIIERALGHATHGENLRAAVADDSSVWPGWCFPAQTAAGLPGKIPNWTLSAGLQARQGIRAMQRQWPMEALFFHTQVSATLCLDWLRRIPSVVSLDATPLQYDALGEFYAHEQGPRWLEHRKWQLQKACFQAARHLVTWSDWAKESLIADYQVPAEKVTVIPPGVDVAQWRRPTNDAHDVVRPVRILFVGGNLARKGGLVLLAAFQMLRQQLREQEQQNRGAEVELHLVTKEPVPPQPGIFVYYDRQPNSAPLRQLFFESDIFCLPTLGDCLPMVLSEAGAANLPLVATRLAAIPEIVRHGETGLLVEPGDVAGLAAALHRLVMNPEWRQRLGVQAAAAVQQRYDSKQNAQRLLALLKQTVNEHDGRR
jgi:glycosyltransferase involved in cell wall biosynthesis